MGCISHSSDITWQEDCLGRRGRLGIFSGSCHGSRWRAVDDNEVAGGDAADDGKEVAGGAAADDGKEVAGGQSDGDDLLDLSSDGDKLRGGGGDGSAGGGGDGSSSEDENDSRTEASPQTIQSRHLKEMTNMLIFQCGLKIQARQI